MNFRPEDELVSTFDAYDLDELESYGLDEILPAKMLDQMPGSEPESLFF